MSAVSPLAEQARSAPLSPGVYLFKDTSGEVIYVGKASVLRNRVRSYFGSSSSLLPKVRLMVSRAAVLEYIVTDSEGEALLLENTLIKQYLPTYNVRLKDDKTYPYIKINPQEPFPQVQFTRKVQLDGARYFGPYANAGSVRRTMDLLNKLFPYRSCTKPITGNDSRPCLEYHINRCLGPCVGAASQEDYRKVIDQVMLFLEGKTDAVVRDLRWQMENAAERMEFEQAARLRDQILSIERVVEEQKVSAAREEDADVIALGQGHDNALVELFPVRGGKVTGRERFVMERTQDEAAGTVLSQFITQFYGAVTFVPPTLLVQHPVADRQAIEAWLTERRGKRVRVYVPQRGDKAKLLHMVTQNAAQGAEERRRQWLSDAGTMEQAMATLQEELELPRVPRRVECYDISNTRGTNAVGSMVVLVDGKPYPPHYRRFQIKGVEGIDDYAMMQEMLRRRFRRLADARRKEGLDPEDPHDMSGSDADGSTGKGATWGIIPDLVLIDGGRGHLSAVHQVFLEMGIDFVPLASLAKEDEELFIPPSPEPIVLPRSSPALFLVQRARDEAHRFAVSYHRRLRSKAGTRSAVDVIPGIGPKRKRLLLRRFGSLKAIKDAPLDDLAAVPGMTRSLAQRVKDHLG